MKRHRAEGKSPQFRLARTARLACLARLAPACRWLDGQDGQLPVGQVVFARPCPQHFDDVGHVVGAGIRLPVSLSRT
jgi:hypothetical protein